MGSPTLVQDKLLKVQFGQHPALHEDLPDSLGRRQTRRRGPFHGASVGPGSFKAIGQGFGQHNRVQGT